MIMKKIIFFSLLFLAFLSSCKDDQVKPVEPENATYKLIITQSGDYENFARYFGLGEGWVYDDTGEDAQVDFIDDHATNQLPNPSYIFRTKNPVKSIEVNLTMLWMPTTAKPSSMKANIKVYRGDELIENSEVPVTSDDDNGIIYSFNSEEL